MRIVSRRLIGTLLGAVVALTALTTLALPSLLPVAGASAATQPISALQFNLCGISCGSGTAVAADVVSAVNAKSPTPTVVTLQEVCGSVYSQVMSSLTTYRGNFVVTKAKHCADKSDYGIAILVRGSASTFLGSWALPNPGNNEPRRIACSRLTITGATRPLVACVTHLDNHVVNTAPQVAAVTDRVNGYAATSAVILGGDFNAGPTNTAFNGLYDASYPSGKGKFVEADSGNFKRTGGSASSAYVQWTNCKNGSPCPTAGNPLYRKVDFIFVTARDAASFTAGTLTSTHSDHLPLRADLVLG